MKRTGFSGKRSWANAAPARHSASNTVSLFMIPAYQDALSGDQNIGLAAHAAPLE
jgi:hypothetical protein